MDTVIMGHKKLYDILYERTELYAKDEMTEEDGVRACELETIGVPPDKRSVGEFTSCK